VRAVVQRVARASVEVDEERVAAIETGLLILLGVEHEDGDEDLEWLVGKLARMRIFPDREGRMNRSLAEADGEALVVSQFTLHASTRRGNRPSFVRAADPALAEPLYERFRERLAATLGRPVAGGRFGAMMRVDLVNDGPVTLLVDSRLRE